MIKFVLIDNSEHGVEGVYGSFKKKDEARKFAALLDWYYDDKHDITKPAPEYTDQDMFNYGWVVIDLIEPDWEQFTK